ncbi:MAG: 50S ribosomal protein L25/general stress protein Ctc [Tannerellaceae bacterium]|nr:50S ribosomal protein L25/general stress protein Ctc [Tannerellaceae bacterium]
MKTFQLEAKGREIPATSADRKRAIKALRKEKEIPAVLYGGEEVKHISLAQEGVRSLIYTPEIFVIDLSIDGKNTKAIIKDVQFQPVTDEIMHIDLLEVFENKPMVIEVPVVLEGYAEGVKSGGKLTLRMRKLKVKALYTNVPERLTINVENLGLGKTIQVGSLSFDNLELLNAKNAVVCAVQLTLAARGAMAKKA